MFNIQVSHGETLNKNWIDRIAWEVKQCVNDILGRDKAFAFY